MMSFDEFEKTAREETALLPDYVFEELSGGVLVDIAAYPHPGRLSDDLYILGTYSRDVTGRKIVLYYGSFAATMAGRSDEQLRLKIRETLRHEFLHHMESRAGLFFEGTLVEEDRERMRTYYLMHGARAADEGGKNRKAGKESGERDELREDQGV